MALLIVSATGVLVAAWPAGAAVVVPEVTVSPSTGLTDGQMVTVAGAGWAWWPSPDHPDGGFDPLTFEIVQCPSAILSAPDPFALLGECRVVGGGSEGDSPDWSEAVPVSLTFSPDGGGAPISCADPGACALGAKAAWMSASATQADYFFYGQPISFLAVGPPTPTSKDQCKGGGWATLGDATGAPFKNQGDCVSFIATRGRNQA